MAEHYCEIHNKEFKQTEKMRKASRGYSHAISNSDGTTSWCNEDAKEVAKLAPQPSDKVLPEHKEVIEEATRVKPAPQELGMWWKEMGNRIGDGSLEKDYPNKAVKIKHDYYKKMSEVTGVDFK